MMDLPSTTYINPPRRMPKETFYRHLKLTTKEKDEFVHGIEYIQMLAVVKPSTMNIADGAEVHEIDVLELGVRGNVIPNLAIEAIAKANAKKILFICSFVEDWDSTYHHVVFRKSKVWEGPDRKGCLGIHYPEVESSSNLDELWERTCARIIFNDDSAADVDSRIEREQKTRRLREEIDKLDKRSKKERQIARKNELFEMKRKKQAELKAFEEGR